MANSVGVLIDGQPVGPRPAGSGAERSSGHPGRTVPSRLRRRLLLGLAALCAALLALWAVVGQVRTHPIPGEGRAGAIAGIAPCPPDRACAISVEPSSLMWDAAQQAFPEYTYTSTTVVFDASTGLSYSESMILTNGGIVLRLTATREAGSIPRPMVVAVTAASSDGMIVTGAPADGVPDRTTTAAMSGPEDALLPVEAAIAWAGILDLLGEAPR